MRRLIAEVVDVCGFAGRQNQISEVRVNASVSTSIPFEVHVSDAAFFEKLYRNGGRWKKYAWVIDAHNAGGATIFTADHDQHKARRHPLNAYFSKARIASRRDLFRRKAGKLCERITEFAGTEQDDFGVGMTLFSLGGGKMWRLSKHIRWYGPAMLAIPKDFLIENADEATANFMRYAKASPLDVAIVTGAGIETTTSVIRLIIYHVFSNPELYPDPKGFHLGRWVDPVAWRKAEKTLAWAAMHIVVSELVHPFDFEFKDVAPDHFEFESDQFIIGTKGKSFLKTVVSLRKG
ncbi:hypothetical protein GGS23DRAFT_595669 [Durotheca rogersii]|uniref:uncharacterized protein n=1 Tax=Durotheca rogersii TaxID=419775 RepID=UPI00221FBAA8|nr:uncharacterized protein GGS23DRAFT_595669 [Durotheca rogersii]KAI5864017.1 hypothetical protein GGS23DRAFT_595669 [Durotheca rogersii]